MLTDEDWSFLFSRLDRIALALEKIADRPSAPAPASGGGSGGAQRGECVKLDDGRFRWTILPEHKTSRCKRCDAEVYWFKTKNDKWVIVDPDGFSHRDRCDQAGNPVATSRPQQQPQQGARRAPI